MRSPEATDRSRPRVPSADQSIRAIARILLTERLDELTDTSLQRLAATEPAYAGPTLDPTERRLGMRRTLELALARLAGGPIPETVIRATADVGHQRAQQGFELPALLHSFQIDLRSLWEAVIAEGRARGLSSDPNFISGCILVWETIEANVAEVVDAYRRTQRHMLSQHDELRQHVFERLVIEGERDSRVVVDAASKLNLPLDGEVLVVLAEDISGRHEELLDCRSRLRDAGRRFHFGLLGDEFIGVVAVGSKPVEDVLSLVEPLGSSRCGAATVERLRLVPRGVRLARAVLAGYAEPGVRLVQSHWIGTVTAVSEEMATALTEQVLGPLSVLGPHDRAAVLETLECYLDVGSIAEVAARTYCHRNTVRNRIQTLERLTGLTVSRPRDTALLAMAVDWLHSPGGQAFTQQTVA